MFSMDESAQMDEFGRPRPQAVAVELPPAVPEFGPALDGIVLVPVPPEPIITIKRRKQGDVGQKQSVGESMPSRKARETPIRETTSSGCLLSYETTYTSSCCSTHLIEANMTLLPLELRAVLTVQMAPLHV
jgi:hypothetical protein